MSLAGGTLRLVTPRVAKRGDLPPELTSFVGRQAELESLVELSKTAPLLTLVGAPGAGKTRLALRLGARLGDRFLDGVWLVEFAPVSDPRQAGRTIAAALGVVPRRGPPQEAIAAWLAERNALLILDNCEHLVSAAAALSGYLLNHCRNLRLVATSRERLRIPGETVWRIEPLSDDDSVALFLDRARSADPTFDAAPQAIATACRRLDGNALAIELAAARTSAMSIDLLTARLEDRFDLLTTGSRTAPKRQQTLLAALLWSYELLSGQEKAVLRSLAVFVDGFTLLAAEAVCKASDPTLSVMDTVASLVEKSLVVAAKDRYRMLETIRHFATDRLAESEQETDDVRRRHAAWVASIATRAEAERATSTENLWLDSLATEHGNVLAALDWAFPNDTGLAAQILVGMSLPWFAFGDFREGRAWLDRALQLVIADEVLRARVLVEAGRFAVLTGDLGLARKRLDRALETARSVGDPELLASCLEHSGILEFHEGRMEEARPLLVESLELNEISGRPVDVASVELRLGGVAASNGDLGEAFKRFSRAAQLCRGRSDRILAISLAMLGSCSLLQGDHISAARMMRQCLELSAGIQDRRTSCYGICLAAALAAADSGLVRAAKLSAAGRTLQARIGLEPEPLWEAMVVRPMERRLDGLSAEAKDSAEAAGRALDFEAAVAFALEVDAGGRSPLTRRELEIASLVVEGMTAGEIAIRLFISERTAESHLERIRGKLGVHSRAEIAAWFVQHRWLRN